MQRKMPFRKNVQESDDWQMTFGDMVTQLFCFFILIAAVSSVDVEQYKEVADSMKKAMGVQQSVAQAKEKDLQTIWQELEKIVVADQNIASFETRANAVALGLKEGVLFPLGTADLNESSYAILKKIAGSLTNIKYRITIEGHTDNLPIQSLQFPSNWELSSARAGAVARLFIANGIPKEKVQIIGYADNKPLMPNTDSQGQSIPGNQAQNRRVVILVHQ
ncbi:MAG: flagellar motor protein MotB [Deltaproteobacteria bacterium HGW-Deltaproteobacteria-6]|jgi:chemotaxis protein MotB|nr:MAG: flagellar motor protein MotB [Deltaproteobacteria bacterium HGW-Deltaproteobacteria-6]